MRSGERGIDRVRIERVARMYASNQAAGQALGIAPRSFSRLCRQHGIETPYSRQRRERAGARGYGFDKDGDR
jgi:hypothetical protein